MRCKSAWPGALLQETVEGEIVVGLAMGLKTQIA